MVPYTLKIPSGSEVSIAAVGNYVRADSAAVDLTVRSIDHGEEVTLSQGDAARLTPFTELRVSHASASEQTVTLLVGNGTEKQSAEVSGEVRVKSPTSLYVQSDVSINAGVGVQLLGADPNRVEAIISAPDYAGEPLRIGGALVAPGFGILLWPGQTAVIRTQGVVRCLNPSGNPSPIAVAVGYTTWAA